MGSNIKSALGGPTRPAGPPPRPLGPNSGDGLKSGPQRHERVRPPGGTTASRRYETDKDHVGGRSTASSGCCRHFKRKHSLSSLVAPAAYLCTCRTGPAGLSSNRFSVLRSVDVEQKLECCARSSQLRRKAQKIVKLLQVDQSLRSLRGLPKKIACGTLRASIRSIYGPELTLAQELSIKTAAKAEVQPCSYCEDLQEDLVEQWKLRRFRPSDSDEKELCEFALALRNLIPEGWNDRKCPYVPNGHATKDHERGQGGNWNQGAFSPECKTMLVQSSGKPRIVTLYAERNVSVLTPLHNSLYSHLKRKGWLLVGSPTDEKLAHLQDGTKGDQWLSFDYESATDNIKTVYVKKAVDELKAKARGLTQEEEDCLDVLAQLSLDGKLASSGQPMGSPMSFPLLCLINKAVVDLALSDLLVSGAISFKEWTSHRCLVNGDDLLTKSTSRGDLRAGIVLRGSQVGLRVNLEKSMVHPEYGEINSTVFKNCTRQKKTNVSSLWMSSDVVDVLGFANESCKTVAGFRMVARSNVSRLARSKTKTMKRLPYAREACLLSDKKLKNALMSTPSSGVARCTNLFPIVPEPAGLELTYEERGAAIQSRVDWIRACELYKVLPKEARKLRKERKEITAVPPEGRSRRGIWKVLRPKATTAGPVTLGVFVDAWNEKRKRQLLEASNREEELYFYPTDLSPVQHLVDLIRTWKGKRDERIPSRPTGRSDEEPSEYVSLSDE